MTEQKQGENPTEINFDTLTPEQEAQFLESEKFILDFKDEDMDDPDKADELRKHHDTLRTIVHQKRHFREKVTKLEAEVENLKKPKDPAPRVQPKDTAGDDSRAVLLEFRQDHPELSKEVVAEVMAHAKAHSITAEEALKKPIIQSYIKSLHKEEDIDEASLGGKRGGGSATGIEKRDWSNASEAEIAEQRRRVMGY